MCRSTHAASYRVGRMQSDVDVRVVARLLRADYTRRASFGAVTRKGPSAMTRRRGCRTSVTNPLAGSLDHVADEVDGETDEAAHDGSVRSEEHTSELQSLRHLVCR